MTTGIVIAQGSVAISNDWWFGGKNCTYSYLDNFDLGFDGIRFVSCIGTKDDGKSVTGEFVMFELNILLLNKLSKNHKFKSLKPEADNLNSASPLNR
ncbi:MAG: hypothetical protein HRT37_22315 [Alteromonadaceae bacterium]|nr:hypothetical protein [Alteromonadaceae bacterium]